MGAWQSRLRLAETEHLCLEAAKVNVIGRSPHSGNTHGPGVPGPRMSVVKPTLATQSDFTEVAAVISQPAIGKGKRHFGVFAALGACGRRRLAWEPVAVATTSMLLCLPRLSARGTALGLISIALGLKELLFPSGEAEVSPTIGTLNRLVLKTHWMTSFFNI